MVSSKCWTVDIFRISRKSECLLFARQKVYGRVLRAAIQFDHVTFFFFNILWCTDELTLLRVLMMTLMMKQIVVSKKLPFMEQLP